MTLGGWFRDYLYIPLGGSRAGFGRLIRNIFVVWLLSGLWHGAGMNFILWGLYYGVLLLIEKLFLRKILEQLPTVFVHIYTLFLVITGFVIFRLEDLSKAGTYLGGMFGIGSSSVLDATGIYQIKSYLWMIMIAMLGVTPLCKNIVKRLKENRNGSMVINILTPIFICGMLLLATAFLIQSSVHPFLYFRF